MFSDLLAIISTFVMFLTANPIDDILLILSGIALVVVFSAVLLARAIRRRISNRSK